MNNKDIQKFIEKNKDKIEVIKNDSGEITNIKILDEKGLDFTDTNCKLSKDWTRTVIVTNDGEKYDASNNLLKNNVVTKAFARNFVRARMFARELPARTSEMIKNFTNRLHRKDDQEVTKDEPNKAPVKTSVTPKADSISTGPVADFNKTKAKADSLMPKIDEILKKYEKSEKYSSDPEIIQFRNKYNEIKTRYDNAVSKHDIPEMLNVKVKLVKLSGQLISKQSNLDQSKKNDKPSKTEENKGTKKENKPTKEKKPRVVKQRAIKAKKVPKTTVSAAKDTKKKDTTKAVITRFKNKYAKDISAFDKTIELCNSKVALYTNEINLLENNLKNIDQIAKDNNFDSRETKLYEQDQQEKLNELKTKLEEAQKELQEAIDEKEAYNKENIDVKLPNQYEESGYIQKRMTREDYYKELKTSELLQERIKINKEKQEKEEEIRKLEELLAQKKAEVSKLNEQDQNKYQEGQNIGQTTSDANEDIGYIQDTVSNFHRSL